MSEPKWIQFIESAKVAGRKTSVYSVINKESKVFLGLVTWYGPFRCYSFIPASGMVFERTCLSDIVKFIDGLMMKRKIEKQNAAQP